MMRPLIPSFSIGNVVTAFSIAVSVAVHGVVDVGLRLGPGLGFHVLHQDVLGFLGRHPGYCLELLVGLGAQLVIFLGFMAERLFLGLKIIFSVFQILLLSLQVSILLIHGDFSLLDAVLSILDLAILVVDELFVLAFQLKEFLLRLMDLLVWPGGSCRS